MNPRPFLSNFLVRLPVAGSALLLSLFAPMLLQASASGTIVSEAVTEPFPGIRLLERVTAEPPMRIYAAAIDLTNENLSVDATAPTRKLRSVEEWARETGALIAVNGDFFRYADGTPHVYGDAAGGGERWPVPQTGRGDHYSDAWFHQHYGWFAFGDFGVTFTATRHAKRTRKLTEGWRPEKVTAEIPPGTRALVSGFSQLVIEGEAIVCEDPKAKTCFPDRGDLHARHPRTAMGLTRDGKRFLLVVVDGRSDESAGMFGTELAALMKELGAWNAINLDGGGSSQMYVKGRGTINAPHITQRRKVLNHWGVFRADSGAGRDKRK